MPKLTKAEITLLNLIPGQFKYIARNITGKLRVYIDKPINIKGTWTEPKTKRTASIKAWQHWFQFIKSSDKEPYEIEKLKQLGYSNEDVLKGALNEACAELDRNITFDKEFMGSDTWQDYYIKQSERKLAEEKLWT